MSTKKIRYKIRYQVYVVWVCIRGIVWHGMILFACVCERNLYANVCMKLIIMFNLSGDISIPPLLHNSCSFFLALCSCDCFPIFVIEILFPWTDVYFLPSSFQLGIKFLFSFQLRLLSCLPIPFNFIHFLKLSFFKYVNLLSTVP